MTDKMMRSSESPTGQKRLKNTKNTSAMQRCKNSWMESPLPKHLWGADYSE
jgi:hypothetical protein